MNALSPVLAMFFGSFLLFGIQPMLGRTLLPPFGGSAAVWTVCLAAYQVLLLVGYGYAHLLAQKPARTQRATHFVLLALAVAWTFAFAALRLFLKGHIGVSAAPSLEVLFCVTLFVGLPYVLLSANSTLIQAWLARGGSLECGTSVPLSGGGLQSDPGERRDGGLKSAGAKAALKCRTPNGGASRNVYKLYAVSNLGSLLGLLAYPFLLEPFVSLNVQWYGFAVCLLAYVGLLALVAKRTEVGGEAPDGATTNRDAGIGDGRPRKGDGSSNPETLEPAPSGALEPVPSLSGLPPALTRAWLWFALPTLSTFLLNAVTMHLSTDVTPVPMMWVLLLTAYLLSFIIGFSVIGEKGLIVWAGLAVVTLTGAAYVSGLQGGRAFLPNLSIGVGTVLACCTCLHGWLYRIRPDASKLTRFYLGIAAGGALGGVSASLLAPVLFNRVWEYPLGLIAVCAACAWLLHVWNHPEIKGLTTFLLLAAGLAAFLVFNNAVKGSHNTVARLRNFYGCLRVLRSEVKTPFGDTLTLYNLQHGETLHGLQVHNRFLKDKPTTYYGPKGGGLAVSSHTNSVTGAPLRVGLIGLGAGTMAAYGRTNDLYRFFEINPLVLKIASNTNFFTFISDSAAKVEFALGDARKRLEQERLRQEPKYDVLVVDAYSGDSIPFHLATREAFQLYLDRLAPDGILAVHISNWHIDLMPLCKAVASAFSLHMTGIIAMPEGFSTASQWVYLTRTPTCFVAEGTREMNWEKVRDLRLPTDEKGSLLPLIRFGHMPPMKDLELDLSKLKLF
ncbi:MAG: fused MFS/spermidine synthase [bacterium]